MIWQKLVLAGLLGLLWFRGAQAETVHVVSNGWHASLVLARADLPEGMIPETADLMQPAFLEIGWGERRYYMSRAQATLGMTLRAAFGPSPAVLHMAASKDPGQAAFEQVAVTFGAADYRRLVAAVDASFARGAARRAPRLAPGLYGVSFFYPATGAFDLFNNCNDWTARMLRAGGLRLSSFGILTADRLMREVREAAKSGGGDR